MPTERTSYTGRTAPGFADRMAAQRVMLDRLRMGGETEFPTAKGDYGSIAAHDGQLREAGAMRRTDVSELKGAELMYEARLLQYLSENQPQPIVALDLGGMAGLSWCRLANRFAEEVDAGRMVFVVSNITFRPELDLNGVQKLTPDEAGFIRDTMSRVHYVNAEATELPLISVSSPAGIIPLRGNVDVINEASSITKHSFVPEYDIASSIPRLMSPRGSYFAYDKTPGIFFEESVLTFYQRQAGIDIAREELVRGGLVLTECVEEGGKKGEFMGFSVFRTPAAPPVMID